MSETVITVENLSKSYIIGHQREKDDGLRHALESAVRAPLTWLRSGFRTNGATREQFWALRDVNFEVKRGEVVGIIGRNGAGKSTLLKILSRITEPTTGRIHLKGRVASLLEVGTGFHPELTGRENIFLNGAILGMSRLEIKRKFDEIVAFAEIERFLDTPVKRYSSGMYVRLAFAVAAHLEPEILIVDEVLAVGDMAFQRKCLGKMEAVARVGRTVLFVSHNMSVIKSLCSRTVLFSEGQTKAIGPTDEIVEQYRQESTRNSCTANLEDRTDRSGSGYVSAVSCEIRSTMKNRSAITPGGSVEFLIEYRGRKPYLISRLYAAIGIRDAYDVGVFGCSTAMLNADFYSIPPRGRIRCQISKLLLVPGRYSVTIKLLDNHGLADEVSQAVWFDVVDGDQQFMSREWGSAFVPHAWNFAVLECSK